jgi:hypothetical protein
LKVYLTSVIRDQISGADRKALKQPTLHTLITLMQKYAQPPLSADASYLYGYREIRNAAEHDGTTPSHNELGNAVKHIRRLILTYLPIDDAQLNQIDFSSAEELPLPQPRQVSKSPIKAFFGSLLKIVAAASILSCCLLGIALLSARKPLSEIIISLLVPSPTALHSAPSTTIVSTGDSSTPIPEKTPIASDTAIPSSPSATSAFLDTIGTPLSESSSEVILGPWEATNSGLTLTIEKIEVFDDGFRVWMQATNTAEDRLDLPLFGYFYVVDDLGNQYEADPFTSTFSRGVASGATITGYAEIKQRLDSDASVLTVGFSTVFGSLTVDSIAVRDIVIKD